MKVTLALLLLCFPARAEDCTAKIEQCKLVIEDYRMTVDLLHQRSTILERQRDEAIKQASNPVLPGYFWVLTGALAGSLVVLYIKK
jgi:hypothetical protein